MVVIPVINCPDVACAAKCLRKISSFGVNWVHVDVVDGTFAPITTWGDPEFIRNYHKKNPRINFEIHLMVKNPERVIQNWLVEGVGRVILHVEAVANIRAVEESCASKNIELTFALLSETPASRALQYINEVRSIQLLAVKPGFSGGDFEEAILEKVKFLKQHAPGVLIEVDGGVSPHTILEIKKAGADSVVSSSYIFGSFFPRHAYQKLVKLAA